MRFIFTLITFFLLTSTAVAFQLSDYKINAKSGKPSETWIKNVHNSPIAVKIDIEPETIREIPQGAYDCSKSLRAFPRLFKLNPQEKQLVRFISRQKGYCRIFFNVDKDNPEKVQIEGAIINIRYRIGIPVEVK